jgi:hypothetical protein
VIGVRELIKEVQAVSEYKDLRDQAFIEEPGNQDATHIEHINMGHA